MWQHLRTYPAQLIRATGCIGIQLPIMSNKCEMRIQQPCFGCMYIQQHPSNILRCTLDTLWHTGGCQRGLGQLAYLHMQHRQTPVHIYTPANILLRPKTGCVIDTTRHSVLKYHRLNLLVHLTRGKLQGRQSRLCLDISKSVCTSAYRLCQQHVLRCVSPVQRLAWPCAI